MTHAPSVVMLFGRPASGKLTLARRLAAMEGIGLFHNHLAVDLLLAVFPFGSPGFVELRERIWLEVMEAAIREGRSLVFTFNPERTVEAGFPERLRERVRAAGGRLFLVEVRCGWEEVRRRIGSESRKAFRKLASVEEFDALHRSGAFEYPPLVADLVVDSEALDPEAATALVSRRFRDWRQA